MANEKPTILTKQGKIDLEKKLTYLKTIKREQVAERIRTAREFGDISENAEYESAKAEQVFVEGTISEIERVLQNCQRQYPSGRPRRALHSGVSRYPRDESSGRAHLQ